MQPKAIIVDDELNNQKVLEKMIAKTPYKIKVMGRAFSIAEAKVLIEDFKPDVVFLDVEMPGGTGFNLLESYESPDFDVIFTTAHDSYALKAFKYAALDYLLKPINYNELMSSLDRLIVKYSDSEKATEKEEFKEKFEVIKRSFNDDFHLTKIALPSSDGLDFIELKRIIRCEADRSYCNFFIEGEDGKVVVSKSLSEFEDLLEESGFFRVHKSYMVNLNHVSKYVRGSGGYLIMSDGAHVPIAVRKKEQLMVRLSAE